MININLRKKGGLYAPHYSLIIGRMEGSLRLVVNRLMENGGLSAPRYYPFNGRMEGSMRLMLLIYPGSREA